MKTTIHWIFFFGEGRLAYKAEKNKALKVSALWC